MIAFGSTEEAIASYSQFYGGCAIRDSTAIAAVTSVYDALTKSLSPITVVNRIDAHGNDGKSTEAIALQLS